MNAVEVKKLTITIGIPAHNESMSISNLLDDLRRQRHENYSIERIVVVCDGCTDQTSTVVRAMEGCLPKLECIDDGQRRGKVRRLEQLYQLNESDILVTLDADIRLSHAWTLTELIAPFVDPNVHLVTGNARPLPSTTVAERIIAAFDDLWYEARKSFRGGNNIYNSVGCIFALRNGFARGITFPAGIFCDQQYLYWMARDHFFFAERALVGMRVPASFQDYFAAKQRFSSEHVAMFQLTNGAIEEAYVLPAEHKWHALWKRLALNPIFTLLAIGLEGATRFLPVGKENVPTPFWETLSSTKHTLVRHT